MLSYLVAEFMKLKRKTIILFALLSAAAYPIINIVYTFNLPKNSHINKCFTDFYKFDFTEWILLPCVLSVIASMLFFTERENNILKQLRIIPLNMLEFLFSKIIVILIYSVLFMIINAVFTILGAFIVGYSDISIKLILRFIKLCIETGVLTSVAMLPIVLIIVISKSDYLIPICAAIIYSFSGAIFATNLVGIHPLASVACIVWRNSIEGVNISGNILMCGINLLVMTIISIAGAVYALKCQEV